MMMEPEQVDKLDVTTLARSAIREGVILAVVLAVIGAVAVLAALWILDDDPADPVDPIRVTACNPVTYLNNGEQRCDAVDPGVARPGQPIPVTGEVCNLTSSDVTLDIWVGWERRDGAFSITTVDSTFTYPPGCETYSVEWLMPPEVVVDAETNVTLDQPELNRWRILGEAYPLPTDEDRFRIVGWDSVRTFQVEPLPE